LFIRNRQAVSVFPDLAWVWRWDKRIKGAAVESYASLLARSAINIKPITANPEVRELVCEVWLETDGTPESYMKFRKSEWAGGLQRRLEYHLYEFEEVHHGQLSEFYNPGDSEQQRQFQALVFEYLKPRLEGTGIWFRSAFFRRPLHD
jgi:hypothetical protein